MDSLIIEKSQLIVGSVTTRWIFSVFTATKIHGLGLFGGERQRREFGFLMRAVTKRLLTATSTTAPIIGFTLFHFDGIGPFLCDYRL